MVHWQSHKPFLFDDESTTDPADFDGNKTWQRLAIRARIHGIEDHSSPFCDQAWIAAFNLKQILVSDSMDEFFVPLQLEILCGNQAIDARGLDIFTFMFSLHSTKYGRAPGYVPGTYYTCVKACVARLNYQSSALPSTRYLFRYVTAAIERESTDARDKIFAFVGVSTDKAVTADYKGSAREVYHEFAVHCIYHFLGDMYWALGARKEIDNLPCWNPDWSVPCRNAWTLEIARLQKSLRGAERREIPTYKVKHHTICLMRTVSCDCMVTNLTSVRLNQSPSMTEQLGNWRGISVTRYDDHQDLFITESGYMGLGVPIMKEGDSVAVLIGVAFPIVLRSEK